MDAEGWVREFAHALGCEPPDARTVEQLLALAAVAAHSSERRAAPIACYLAGRDGRAPAELRDLADEVGDGD